MDIQSGRGVLDGNTYNLFRSGKRTNDLPNLQRQFLDQLRIIRLFTIVFGLHTDESMDSLASNVVCTSYDGCFCDALVEDEGGFDFGGG